MFERKLDDIVDALGGLKAPQRQCCVILGAGCSRSAGIPVASEIVRSIRKRYSAAYSRAALKDYPSCMAALDFGVRRDLIGGYIDKAKINWAHIGLAQIIQSGRVDRVLTTNFDPLVARACALVNVFPAIYDFAASHQFKPDQVGKQAIFHLHGQRDGFVILNTATEVKKHKRHLAPIVEDSVRGRVLIVVGYSGDNDPLFDLLTRTKRFDYGLYWVGRGPTPPDHVLERLLTPEKGAYFLGNWDADDFFVALARRLHCFPPSFVRKPFSYLKANLASLSDYKALNEDGRFDITAGIRRRLEALIDEHENSLSAEYHFLADEYEDVAKLFAHKRSSSLKAVDRDLLAWSYLMQGNQLHDKAKEKESEQLYKQAAVKFRLATKVGPELYAAYFNWGNVLFDLSHFYRHGVLEFITAKSERFMKAAVAKYKLALAIYAYDADVHNNYANALTELAQVASAEDEILLLKEALKHYKRAVLNSETPATAYCNWGKALYDLFRKTRSIKTLNSSFEKFRAAASHDPNHYSTFLSWGNALADLARKRKSKAIFTQAFNKYRRAAEISPNDVAANFNWANELTVLAEIVGGTEKKKLLKEAETRRRAGRGTPQ